jgi:hypothetical protein
MKANNDQKLKQLLNLIEFEEDGTITISGNLLIKGSVKAMDVIVNLREEDIASKKSMPNTSFLALQLENENLRYENQRLSIINHYHRGETI